MLRIKIKYCGSRVRVKLRENEIFETISLLLLDVFCRREEALAEVS